MFAAVANTVHARASERPVVYQRQGESFTDAAARYRRDTGHAGWCIIVMRKK
jgi:hypothetical protein